MIPEHQPPEGFFPDGIEVIVSDLSSGNQSFRVRGSVEESPESDHIIVENRRRLLGRIGLEIEQTALVYLHYEDGLSYTDFAVVTDEDLGKGMAVSGEAKYHDGLAVEQPEQGVFLPLADCYGVVIYDPVQHKGMVVHLGRHGTNNDGARASIEFMKEKFTSSPEDLLIWFTPGIGEDSYPMNVVPSASHHDFARDPRWQRPGMSYIREDQIYLNLRAFNIAGFESVGVRREHITWADVDTATDPHYPSHSRGANWRFAVVMKLRAT